MFSKFYYIKPKSDCIYHYPIDLEPNGSKSIGEIFGTKRFQINRCMVNRIWFQFDLIRFQKDVSVCVNAIATENVGIFFLRSKLNVEEDEMRAWSGVKWGALWTFCPSRATVLGIGSFSISDFHFLSNWMGYDRGDSFSFNFEPNVIPFGSKCEIRSIVEAA